ncbi:MAG: hypothetical protein O7D34_11385 [Ignavibacteria bacterium]|nr:hypothetical protein [Ignavibacteria bacterium]
MTRRQALRAGGLTALGLVFTKPVIETIRPLPAFAQYAPPVTPTPTPTPTATPTPLPVGTFLYEWGIQAYIPILHSPTPNGDSELGQAVEEETVATLSIKNPGAVAES